MLRHGAYVLLGTLFLSFLSIDLSNSKPPADVPRADEPPPVFGLVRAAGYEDRFDPFGVIVPLPELRLEQLAMPAFDPALHRGGRIGEPLGFDELCDMLEEVAGEYDLPLPLFARLIWQESRFRNETVSRKGAQGIAQFMPATAAERGLDDPFDPIQALPASADFLRELMDRFGNFGLAAAAYNGGPGRVQRWLDGRARLPRETRDYVLRITGRPAEHWRKEADADPHPDAFKVKDCRVKPIRAALSASARKKR